MKRLRPWHRPNRAGSAPSAQGPAARRADPEASWREEFPYVWSEDEVVTRRDTLFFLLAGSGALCLATGTLALIGAVSEGSPAKVVPVARVDELGENGWKVFAYPDEYAQGILINLPGKGLVAYSDVCTHLSCAVTYQPESRRLYCPCHEGLFDAATGDVLAGPPTRPLPIIELEERQGTIYAVRMVLR
ncbi:MAG: Rieske 2Fe-2S domain-containing protein [Thermogemmatispora sp.]|nr:Rieske 2Fe-2S domain-containing protein [Thermogemmatispora sp.]